MTQRISALGRNIQSFFSTNMMTLKEAIQSSISSASDKLQSHRDLTFTHTLLIPAPLQPSGTESCLGSIFPLDGNLLEDRFNCASGDFAAEMAALGVDKLLKHGPEALKKILPLVHLRKERYGPLYRGGPLADAWNQCFAALLQDMTAQTATSPFFPCSAKSCTEADIQRAISSLKLVGSCKDLPTFGLQMDTLQGKLAAYLAILKGKFPSEKWQDTAETQKRLNRALRKAVTNAPSGFSYKIRAILRDSYKSAHLNLTALLNRLDAIGAVLGGDLDGAVKAAKTDFDSKYKMKLDEDKARLESDFRVKSPVAANKN